MKKRILAMLLACAMMFSFSACSSASEETSADGLVSGTYETTVNGFGGEMALSVTLTDSVITDVTVTSHGETDGIGAPVTESMPAEMVAGNTVNVDAVAGATITSNAIIEGVTAALAAAGLDAADYATKVATEAGEDQELEADIVIIGAGGAGMISAITAAQAGQSVIIVESQSMVGGNSIRATGGMNATETVYQDDNEFAESAGVEAMLESAAAYADNEAIAALTATVQAQWDEYQANPEGYFDSSELMQLDTLVGGYGTGDATLVATLVNNTAAAIDWLADIGIELTSVGAFGGASVKRIHRPVDDTGSVLSVGTAMVPVLEEVCAANGIEIILNTTVSEILMTDGAATGVFGTATDGSTLTVNASAVIVATGGFGANSDMVVEYAPELEGFAHSNAAGAQGDGIVMGVAVGAATVALDSIQIHPTLEYNTSALITEGLRGDGAILVNAEGLRFYDEVGTRDAVSAAEIAQTGSYSWLIVDQKMVDASSVIQGYITKGYTYTGETYEELAAAIGVDEATFAQTMETWNAAVAAGVDEEFGRVSFADALDTAPYYAIQVTAGVHHTMGGLEINEYTEVLDVDGNIIPGLYAAGEVTGGIHGDNRLGGNAVADFVVFGRIAGASASAYVG